MDEFTLAGYRLLSRLGAGTCGVVYDAVREPGGESVAVKVIPFGAHNGETLRARATQEGRLTWSLNHPHVVQVYSWAIEESFAYLVMERLYGETLGARIERGKIPLDEALNIAQQAARGLSAIHARGAVHRDVKPDNLFLAQESGREVVKVLDLGISKIVEDDPAHCVSTGAGLVYGTPAYMSPEQAYGDPTDARADVYALGATLYHMILGTIPWQRKRPKTTLVARTKMTHLPALPDFVPAEINRLIWDMTARSVDNRLPSAEAVLARLDQLGGQVSDHLNTTVLLGDRTVAVGDVTVPALGDWKGMVRFRDHVLLAATQMFSPGHVPALVLELVTKSQALEQSLGLAKKRAGSAVRAAAEVAQDDAIAVARQAVEVAAASLESRRGDYVSLAARATNHSAETAHLDREYTVAYKRVVALHRAASAGAVKSGQSLSLDQLFDQKVADAIAEMETARDARGALDFELSRRRVALAQALDRLHDAERVRTRETIALLQIESDYHAKQARLEREARQAEDAVLALESELELLGLQIGVALQRAELPKVV